MKSIGSIAALGVLLLLLGSCISCTKSKVNSNDATPPQLQIKVKGGDNQYQPMTSVDLFESKQIDLMSVVTDSDGVRSLDLSFSGSPASSCTVGGTIYSGSFYFPLPAAMQQTLQPDASGQVLDTLPLLATVKDPGCNVPGVGPGRPIGNTITVHSTGKNWSSNAQNSTATANLKINIK